MMRMFFPLVQQCTGAVEGTPIGGPSGMLPRISMLSCQFLMPAARNETLWPASLTVEDRAACRWQLKYFEAKTCLTGRDEQLAEVSELIERNLILVGCTAIEDKLQEGVPECIEHLANAGIRIWVLTGDKQVRTAESDTASSGHI